MSLSLSSVNKGKELCQHGHSGKLLRADGGAAGEQEVLFFRLGSTPSPSVHKFAESCDFCQLGSCKHTYPPTSHAPSHTLSCAFAQRLSLIPATQGCAFCVPFSLAGRRSCLCQQGRAEHLPLLWALCRATAQQWGPLLGILCRHPLAFSALPCPRRVAGRNTAHPLRL